MKRGIPFCRNLTPETIECDKYMIKRIEVNDQDALTIQGHERYKKGDYSEAFEYWTKAAELEDVEAHFRLSDLYRFGEKVLRRIWRR